MPHAEPCSVPLYNYALEKQEVKEFILVSIHAQGRVLLNDSSQPTTLECWFCEFRIVSLMPVSFQSESCPARCFQLPTS